MPPPRGRLPAPRARRPQPPSAWEATCRRRAPARRATLAGTTSASSVPPEPSAQVTPPTECHPRFRGAFTQPPRLPPYPPNPPQPHPPLRRRQPPLPPMPSGGNLVRARSGWCEGPSLVNGSSSIPTYKHCCTPANCPGGVAATCDSTVPTVGDDDCAVRTISWDTLNQVPKPATHPPLPSRGSPCGARWPRLAPLASCPH